MEGGLPGSVEVHYQDAAIQKQDCSTLPPDGLNAGKSNELHSKKRVVKRSMQYERARDARRLQKWIARRQDDAVVTQSAVGMGAMKMGGGYVGHRDEGPSASAVVVVPYNGGHAARIVDKSGRMFVYRGTKGAATEAANNCAQAAAAFLAESQINPSERNGKRGDFDQFYFILHRESQERPRMHSYFMNHTAHGLYAAAVMKPIQKLVDGECSDDFWE
uniref:N/A n=1 Tax=Ganoderma boninense TaxID=34458 RepID=A0A5K1JS41_9APHY|nr:N/A [Ganoderma boninense]